MELQTSEGWEGLYGIVDPAEHHLGHQRPEEHHKDVDSVPAKYQLLEHLPVDELTMAVQITEMIIMKHSQTRSCGAGRNKNGCV